MRKTNCPASEINIRTENLETMEEQSRKPGEGKCQQRIQVNPQRPARIKHQN